MKNQNPGSRDAANSCDDLQHLAFNLGAAVGAFLKLAEKKEVTEQQSRDIVKIRAQVETLLADLNKLTDTQP